jgi:hypothetical protein
MRSIFEQSTLKIRATDQKIACLSDVVELVQSRRDIHGAASLSPRM